MHGPHLHHAELELYTLANGYQVELEAHIIGLVQNDCIFPKQARDDLFARRTYNTSQYRRGERIKAHATLLK
jgi:hypothetical protein